MRPNIKRGYTLIEFLVAITLMTTIFLIGYASFREFSRRQALTGITKKVTADLRLAQQQSLTGEKPDTCDTLEGYSFTPLPTSYTINANCLGGDVQIKEVFLEDNITMSGSPIQFKVLGQGTNLGVDTTLTVSHDVLGQTADIIITKDGQIN